jgi:DNA polymerase zeta
MRNEQALKSYTLENVAFHVLRKRSVDFPSVFYNGNHRSDITRMPLYNFSTLTRWFNGGVPAHTAQLLRYFVERTSVVLMILEEAEVITKTACAVNFIAPSALSSRILFSEFARVFGVDFYSVISRGSQFKVESVVFRIAKPESFVLISPSKQDVRVICNALACWLILR